MNQLSVAYATSPSKYTLLTFIVIYMFLSASMWLVMIVGTLGWKKL